MTAKRSTLDGTLSYYCYTITLRPYLIRDAYAAVLYYGILLHVFTRLYIYFLSPMEKKPPGGKKKLHHHWDRWWRGPWTRVSKSSDSSSLAKPSKGEKTSTRRKKYPSRWLRNSSKTSDKDFILCTRGEPI